MRHILSLLFISFIFANDQIPGTDQKRPILLKGGTLHTVSGDILEGYDDVRNLPSYSTRGCSDQGGGLAGL